MARMYASGEAFYNNKKYYRKSKGDTQLSVYQYDDEKWEVILRVKTNTVLILKFGNEYKAKQLYNFLLDGLMES